MAKERIRIEKQSYKRGQIRTSLDTEFNTFKEEVEEVDLDTVEEFFRLYDKLFFSIPVDGENNSHTYLLEKSSELTDFDKNTDVICKANNLGAGIEIYGYKNHIYYFHKLKELGFDNYYKGYYSKNIKDISKLYAETNYLIDMSTIKKDGGGTQYTFLEAEYHNCALILHKDWCSVKGSIYKNNENCYAVSNEKELLDAINKNPLHSNVLPTDEDNDNWKKILI